MKSRSEIFMTAGFSYLFNGPFFSDKSQIVWVTFFCNSLREKKKERRKSYSCSRQSLCNSEMSEENDKFMCRGTELKPANITDFTKYPKLAHTPLRPLSQEHSCCLVALTACATNCNLSCQFKPISQFVNALFRRVFG